MKERKYDRGNYSLESKLMIIDDDSSSDDDVSSEPVVGRSKMGLAKALWTVMSSNVSF